MTKPQKTSLALFLLFLAGWTFYLLMVRYTTQHKPTGDFSGIQAEKVLRVCGEYDPFSFYTDNSGQHGFHYELMLAFAEGHGLALKYTYEGDFNKRLERLKLGACDVLTGPLALITPLKKDLSFTNPIYASRLVLVQQRSDKALRNQVKLAGKVLTLAAHSPHAIRINHLALEISDSIYLSRVKIFTNEDLIKRVAANTTTLAVMDEKVAKAYCAQYPTVDANTSLSLPQFQAWAVRPNSLTLLDSLNAFLDRYKKSPEGTRLFKKYGVASLGGQ